MDGIVTYYPKYEICYIEHNDASNIESTQRIENDIIHRSLFSAFFRCRQVS